MNKIGICERNKILEYHNIIKNNEIQGEYFMLTILRNEMTNEEINNFNNYLINNCDVKNSRIKYLIFQDNFFLLFILELNDKNNIQLYKIQNVCDIINIISKNHYDILLDENNPNSCLLKTAYLYTCGKHY